ncbi:MAG TPA: PepSY domain-containing protein [Hyphomonadaceae bacterium]|nr:PepSY domain-containing protein [Hyphomonadaceae bacterium]HPN07537.1 PepSY domain-containing protein [Hyphomonadaceae bacterium]
MISPRLARRTAQIHKWLGLIVFAQLVVWTSTGLFFVAVHITDVRADNLVHPANHVVPVDMAQVKVTSADALKAVAEDRPYEVTLKALAGLPVYEIRAEIGTFLVSAETGERIVIDEALARRIATAAWVNPTPIRAIEELETAPRESTVSGNVWAAHFEGEGDPTLYISAVTGRTSNPRTDLWRTYDFLYGMHLMDYAEHENFNTPWMLAAAILALSTVLFGVALLVHRLTRGFLNKDKTA